MDEPSAVELRNNGAETGRGGKRPIWDLWYGHCKKVGMPAKYCGEFASVFVPMQGRNSMAAVAVRSTSLATAHLCSTTNKSARLADITEK